MKLSDYNLLEFYDYFFPDFPHGVVILSVLILVEFCAGLVVVLVLFVM